MPRQVPQGRNMVDLHTRLGQPSHKLFSSCYDQLLVGSAVGSVTEIPIYGPNSAILNDSGAIPISRPLRAGMLALSMKFAGSAPVGTYTLTLHRVRNLSAEPVATFSFDA